MKNIKSLFVLLFIISGIQISKSQLFISGSFGINAGTSKSFVDDADSDGPSTFGLSVKPRVGYFIMDNVAVGLGIGPESYRVKTPGTPEVITSAFSFEFNPFARYYFIETGNLSLFAEGGMDLGIGKQKTKTGGTTADGPNTFDIMFYLSPAIEYSLSDKISIEAIIGGVYMQLATEKQEIGGVTYKDRSFDAGFGIDATSIIFGVTYKL